MASPKSGDKTKSQGSAGTSAPKKDTAAKGDGSAKASKGGRGGIAQPVQPDAELAAIVGKDPLPRSELTKKVWDYIKKHDLQDAKDRRQINPDDKMKKVLGPNPVSMFEMTRLVNQHVK